ncbi:MAG: isocitrate lyase/phosphoenolpyruvate mutase family protein [Chthoniobacterales bacterium]|nr:isocitrate lyase/phosphoenolpyruvate mutase family protein [Chthoniobacterales bacterium]
MADAANSVAARRRVFRELHREGCFAIPNPWDVGSARYLEHLRFPAIATSSAGFAFSVGLPDNAVPLDAMLRHIQDIVEATNLPVNADFENGYADKPDDVAENVRRCVTTGVAGLSIEDATGRTDKPLYDITLASERIAAARTAIGKAEVILVGRAECFLVGIEDIDEVIRRLTAYAEAGADCLYAPGIRTREHIAAVVAAVAPKPVNLLIGSPVGLTMGDAAALGVRRVSVGSGLVRVAWGAFMRAAGELAERGSFAHFGDAAPHAELNEFFREDAQRRTARAG